VVAKSSATRPVVVLAVLRDIHNLGILVLRHALEGAGFRVINAGAMLSPEEIIAATIEAAGDAILISSSYGMAALDAAGFRGKCEEAGLKDILLYIGGNLSVTQQSRPWPEVEAEFKELGFDGVYGPGTAPAGVIADLKRDLGIA